ncbi:hypothetical protein YC2023_107519 [Brassica napus]
MASPARFYKVLNTRQKIPVIVHDEDEKLNSNSFVKDTISKLTCDFRNKLLTYVKVGCMRQEATVLSI